MPDRAWVESGWKDATLKYLSGLPVERWPSQRRLASRLDIPEQLFRYYLSLEGTNYRALKKHVRRQRIQAIVDAQGFTSVSQISESLGYSEPSSFRRSFKKWHGCTPGAYFYRQQSLGHRAVAG